MADNPLVIASRAMLKKGKKRYGGLEHAEAAGALRKTDPSGAISAMLTSAFFDRARNKTISAPILGAYRSLITELGSESHTEAMKRQKAALG